MTNHQDNAARLARIAQIAAVVMVLVAIGAFLISIPADKLETGPVGGIGANPGVPGPDPDENRFHVPEEDWTIALGPLTASRDPITVASNGSGGINGKGPNGTDGEAEPTPTVTRDPRNRPPIRYLGSLGDGKGLAALIDFAGQQQLVRIGQEFQNEYEITEITPEQIIVADGFDEFTIALEPSSLANAIPNPIINPAVNRSRGRENPNAFPGGRSTPPGRPEGQPPADDDEGTDT